LPQLKEIDQNDAHYVAPKGPLAPRYH